MNSNLVHNILNVLLIITPLAATLGCTDTGITYDCSHSILGPKYALWLELGFGAIKLIMNIGRDGLSGLVKPQPPVADAITTVVTPVVKASPGDKIITEVVATAQKKS